MAIHGDAWLGKSHFSHIGIEELKSDEQLRSDEVRPCPIDCVGGPAAPEVISRVPPPFNPTTMSRLEGRPVVRSPKQLRPHPALEEIG